ncbi:MAG: PAS domain-containing protein [Verrucomicrobiales bacterium]
MEPLATMNNGKPIRVLLVDDDEDSYILTRHQLSKIKGQGLHLDWAPTYDAGLEMIRKNAHDVYLLDYRLGARNGLDLLREALAIGCKAPIIILTTENPEVDAEAMRLGAADFLSKDHLNSALLERSIRYAIKHFDTLRTLREREAQMEAFMQNVPCAVYMKDVQGRYIYVNEAYAQVFRRKVEDFIGKSDEMLWPKNVAQKIKNADQHALNSKKAHNSTESIVHEDGTHSWLTTRFPILDEHGQPAMVGAAAVDITENKRLESEIQEISEKEKRRIGQDLHDGLGQYLTGIACMVKVVEQKLATKGLPEAGDVKKITNMVNETIFQARDLARGLCPVELETNGLQAALQELANRLEKLFKVNCTLKAPQLMKVYDNASAVHLYRIAQEAVNNAIKHGKATAITISLMPQNNQAVLTITDNGCGLPKGANKANGMGLRVMNYRANMIGATVTIEQAPEGGVMVRCSMPNQPPAKPGKKPASKAEKGKKADAKKIADAEAEEAEMAAS